MKSLTLVLALILFSTNVHSETIFSLLYNKNYQNEELDQADTEVYDFVRGFLKLSPSNISISSVAEPIDLEILFDDFMLQEDGVNLLLVLDISEYPRGSGCPCLGGQPFSLNAQIQNIDYESTNKNTVLFLIGGNYQYSSQRINVYNVPAEVLINNKLISSIQVLNYILKKISTTQPKVSLSDLVKYLSVIYDIQFPIKNDFVLFNLPNKLRQDIFTTSDSQINDEMNAKIVEKELLKNNQKVMVKDNIPSTKKEKKPSKQQAIAMKPVKDSKTKKPLDDKSSAKKEKKSSKQQAIAMKPVKDSKTKKSLDDKSSAKKEKKPSKQQSVAMKPVKDSKTKKSKSKDVAYKSLSWLESECMLGNVRTQFDDIKLQAKADIDLIKSIYQKSIVDFSEVKICFDKKISNLSLSDTTEFKYKLKETELSLFSLDMQIILFDKELQLKNEAEKLKDKKKRNATSFSF